MFDSRTKARSLACLFTASAFAGVLAVILPADTPVNDGTVLGLAGLSVLISIALLRFGDQIPDTIWHVTLATFTIVLSLAVHFTHQETLFALIYMWPALFAFYFFEWRVAIAHLALIGGSYAFVLSAEDDAVGIAVRLVLVLGTPLAVGVMISRLLDGLHAGIERSAHQEQALRNSEQHTADRRERRVHLDQRRGSRAGPQCGCRAAAGPLTRGRDRPAHRATRYPARLARRI